MCLRNDANDTLSICLVTAKIPRREEGGAIRSRGRIKDANDSNGQHVPRLTLVISVTLYFPNSSEWSHRET